MPYVEVHIDAEDYISDIKTEHLQRELKRRGADVPENDMNWIVEELMYAWNNRDLLAFERAIKSMGGVEKEYGHREAINRALNLLTP